MRSVTWRSVVGVVGVLALAGCGDDDDRGGVGVVDAWSRQPASGQQSAAVYGIVENGTGSDLRLVAASSPVTDDVQLHETIVADDGTMQMDEREDGFEIPAGGQLVLEPGGSHMMLLGIDPESYPRDGVEVTLEFAGADPVTFEAEVREIAG